LAAGAVITLQRPSTAERLSAVTTTETNGVEDPEVDASVWCRDGHGVDLIVWAVREERLRPRAVRTDSTIVEADVRYPTDAGLASSGVQGLRAGGPQAREADQGEERRG